MCKSRDTRITKGSKTIFLARRVHDVIGKIKEDDDPRLSWILCWGLKCVCRRDLCKKEWKWTLKLKSGRCGRGSKDRRDFMQIHCAKSKGSTMIHTWGCPYWHVEGNHIGEGRGNSYELVKRR
jgi:hypothetical protein